MPPLDTYLKKGTGYYDTRFGRDILNHGQKAELETFVHEYGHRIEHQLIPLFKDGKNMNLWKNLSKDSKVLGTFYSPDLQKIKSIATLSADKLVDDAKELSKNLRKRKMNVYNERRLAQSKAPDSLSIIAREEYYKKLNATQKSILSEDEIKEYLAFRKKGKVEDVLQSEIYSFHLKLKNKVVGGDFSGYDEQFTTRFNDFVGAITKESIGAGHGKTYYSDFRNVYKSGQRVVTEGQVSEAWAEYITMEYQPNTKIKNIENKLMEYFAPNLKPEYDRYIKEFNKL